MSSKLTVYKFESDTYSTTAENSIGEIEFNMSLNNHISVEVYFWSDFGLYISEIAYFKKYVIGYNIDSVGGSLQEVIKDVQYEISNFSGGALVNFEVGNNSNTIKLVFECNISNVKHFCRVVLFEKNNE